MNIYHKNSGFTLIELMISLVLGLLVTAAAIQLFTSGLITTRLQQANAEIQDSGIFGIEYIVHDLRLTNFGNDANPVLDDTTPWGGVVLTAISNTVTAANFSAKTSSTTYLADGLLSHSEGDTTATTPAWNGASNVSWVSGAGTGSKSDQLTIQFVAPAAMQNCEGTSVLAGDLVVERYFMRKDDNGSTTDYVLACDANTPSATATAQPATITGLGDKGQIVIPRIDHFHVLLGVKQSDGKLVYYTIKQYKTAAGAARTAGNTAPRIMSIQLSILSRSTDNTNAKMIDPTKTFNMLDQTVTPTDTTTRYARQVYTTTVALRNGFGVAS